MDVEIIKLISTKLIIPNEWKIEWKRGPQSDSTSKFIFNQKKKEHVEINEKFERISKFRYDKNNKVQTKDCEFRVHLYTGKASKILTEKKYEMT